MEYTHSCIKCSESYKDSDPDPYYCSSCVEQKNILAKEVDEKLKRIPRKQTKSELQIYDEISKARGSRFINIKDLGISL